MKFARLEHNGHRFLVAEIITAPVVYDGIETHLSDLYHPSLVLTMRKCDDAVNVGDTFDPENETYTEYVAPVEAAAAEQDTGNGEPPR